jgi:hypothetical protein
MNCVAKDPEARALPLGECRVGGKLGYVTVGVERKKGYKSQCSYVVWEEQGIVPILTLEMVSHKPGGEYDEKMAIYAHLGVLYYVVYNPEFWRRNQHQPFEVYKLMADEYQLQTGEPYWIRNNWPGLMPRELAI